MSSGGQPLPPIDPNVVIPRGVKASSAKADEIHKAAYNTGDTPPASGAGNEQPVPGATQPQPTHPTPPATPPASAQTPPAAAAPAPQPQPPPETADDWKQRYQSLKGRFDTQANQLANANTRLTSLETLVAGLQRPAPARTAPPPAPRSQTKRLTADDVKEYGEDMINVVKKAALDAIEPVLEQRVTAVRTEVNGRLQDITSKVGNVEREGAVSAHQRLLDFMDKNLDTWRTINHHPAFHSWLALTDPLSGAIRKNLLNDAVAKGDGSRALTFYRMFLAEKGVPAPANGNGNQPPPNTNGNGNGAATVDLASLAAPGRPAASGTTPVVPDNSNGEIITRAEISAFYRKKNAGGYTPEEAARLEAEVFKAGREGRIR